MAVGVHLHEKICVVVFVAEVVVQLSTNHLLNWIFILGWFFILYWAFLLLLCFDFFRFGLRKTFDLLLRSQQSPELKFVHIDFWNSILFFEPFAFLFHVGEFYLFAFDWAYLANNPVWLYWYESFLVELYNLEAHLIGNLAYRLMTPFFPFLALFLVKHDPLVFLVLLVWFSHFVPNSRRDLSYWLWSLNDRWWFQGRFNSLFWLWWRLFFWNVVVDYCFFLRLNRGFNRGWRGFRLRFIVNDSFVESTCLISSLGRRKNWRLILNFWQLSIVDLEWRFALFWRHLFRSLNFRMKSLDRGRIRATFLFFRIAWLFLDLCLSLLLLSLLGNLRRFYIFRAILCYRWLWFVLLDDDIWLATALV